MASQDVLAQILAKLNTMEESQKVMKEQLDALTAERQTPGSLTISSTSITQPSSTIAVPPAMATMAKESSGKEGKGDKLSQLYPSRVILTTYPSQHGITPYPLTWNPSENGVYSKDPKARGPIICSRMPSTIKYRNAIGAHSGSYSIYRALSIALGSLDPNYKPDYTMTEPPVEIPWNENWGKIVSFDPWGHEVQRAFKDVISGTENEGGLDIRPSIAITRAHIKLSEVDDSVRRGEVVVDGKIVLKSAPIRKEDGSVDESRDPGVEIAVSKAAVEPVWYLPGVAERFGISEALLRRALFEDTGGMYPELITRNDIKAFLPPIGNLTVYIFGNPQFMSDESKECTLRVHDECNGSDVFGSDICTCKPYLVYAIEECIRTAQRGGVGVVVYFRKEGRALGEVTKYLVYNLRKRGGDSADRYFKSTEMIAGVKDMRFQGLMPDILQWLGIKKIDNMVSMSDMKYDAITKVGGIPIKKRYDIPDHLIPPDSRVEIDAKIAAGYFSSNKQITQEDLKDTVGRGWEDSEH